MGNKKTIYIIIGILIVISFFAIKNISPNVSVNVINQEAGNLHEVRLDIKDMYCEACAYGVSAQLKELDGVYSADINYVDGSGVVTYDADKLSAETIAQASTAYPALVVGDIKI